MLFSRREPVSRTPAEVGLAYEPVAFEASDGVGIKGWFIPADGDGPKPTVVFVHGWMWNRLGNVAGRAPIDDRDVDFLPATKALHDAGYSVLLYDIRKHGESESGKGLLSFGPLEKYDFIGAVNYLRTPRRRGRRADRLARHLDGRHDRALRRARVPADQGHPGRAAGQGHDVQLQLRARPVRRRSGPRSWRRSSCCTGSRRRRRRAPRTRARRPSTSTATIVKYVQGTGDRWGTMVDVARVRGGHADPDGPVVHYPSSGRYDGYRYVSAETDDASSTSSSAPLGLGLRAPATRAQERVERDVRQDLAHAS